MHHRPRFRLFLGLLLGLAISCGGGRSNPGPLAQFTVSTGSLAPSFNSSVTEYEATSLNSINPVSITATCADPAAYAITVNGLAAASGSPVAVSLATGEDIQVVLTPTANTGTVWAYRVHYLPAGLPGFTISTDATRAVSPGYVLATAGTWLLITDKQGNIRYYQNCGTAALDFQRFDLAGSAYYAYFAQDPNVAQVSGTVTGSVHLLDGQFQEVRTIRFQAGASHGEFPADAHEFHLYSPTHWLVVSYVPKTLDLSGLNAAWGTAAQVNACLIQEVQDGAVVFEWDSTDHPQLYSDSVDQNAFANGVPSDYAHLNSVTIDPGDGNFIVSLRHTDSVIKVDRATGQILWNLGGASDNFGLTPAQRFSHQHHATLLDTGELLLFDNGNPAGPTRVLSFTLNAGPTKAVAAFAEICRKPADWTYTSFMGSACLLGPGRYLVGWGGVPANGLGEPDVSEMLDGTPVWSLAFSKPGAFSYRAFPIPASAF